MPVQELSKQKLQALAEVWEWEKTRSKGVKPELSVDIWKWQGERKNESQIGVGNGLDIGENRGDLRDTYSKNSTKDCRINLNLRLER